MSESLQYYTEKAHKNASSKGFWDAERDILLKMEQAAFTPEEVKTVKNAFVTQKLMLIVNELSEAIEALRNNDNYNFKEEIADTFIRWADFCGGSWDLDGIEDIIQEKMQYNQTRPYLHKKEF